MIRLFVLYLCGLALPLLVWGQESADSVATRAVSYFGTSITYRDLLREYADLHHLPEPEDTTKSDSPDARIQRLEIDGLVVDETMTKLGRDFYDVFFRLWKPPDAAINFTVSVQEQPAPGTGTIVSVLVSDDLVFQTRLQPQLEYIETAAQQAVYLAFRHLERGEAQIVY